MFCRREACREVIKSLAYYFFRILRSPLKPTHEASPKAKRSGWGYGVWIYRFFLITILLHGDVVGDFLDEERRGFPANLNGVIPDRQWLDHQESADRHRWYSATI